MRNRAKCKLCKTIIESFHAYDYVTCQCGEIAVDGGEGLYCIAKDWSNFMRLDDADNEIQVTVHDRTIKNIVDTGQSPTDDDYSKYKISRKKDLLEMLDQMQKNIENLPQHAMTQPITHYDFCSLLMLLSSIFRAAD